jgi:hypothetical protein
MAIVLMLTVILFVVVQNILSAQDTTGWSAIDVTLVFLFGTILLLAVVVLVFRAIAGSR